MTKIVYTIGGIILIIIGIFLIYETYIDNLIDIMFIIGIILILIGVIIPVYGISKENLNKNETVYDNALKALNNRKNDLQNETKEIIKLGQYNNNNSESIFTSINKQFAERFNENTYETPKKYNPSLSEYEDLEEDNTSDIENKKVLKINRNWDQPTEDLKPIKTEHEKEPPKSIYNEDKEQTYNYTAKYQRPEKIQRKPKKREEQIEEKEEKHEINKPTVIPNLTNTKNTITESQIKDNSYIIYEDNIISLKEAFNSIINNTKEEILIQTPNLKYLNAKTLTKLSTVKTKLLIQEFDLNEKYTSLLQVLIKEGVEIKTIPTIDTINIISDKSQAILISKNNDNEIKYGTAYTDKDSVENIIENFNSLWNLGEKINNKI